MTQRKDETWMLFTMENRGGRFNVKVFFRGKPGVIKKINDVLKDPIGVKTFPAVKGQLTKLGARFADEDRMRVDWQSPVVTHTPLRELRKIRRRQK